MSGCTEPSPFPQELTVGPEVTDVQAYTEMQGLMTAAGHRL